MDALAVIRRATLLDRITATFQIAEKLEMDESRRAGKFEYCLCGQKTIMPDVRAGGTVYCSTQCAEHFRMIGTAYDDGSYFGIAAPYTDEERADNGN